MNTKLIVSKSFHKTKDKLPHWKCLRHEDGKIIYDEINMPDKRIIFFI